MSRSRGLHGGRYLEGVKDRPLLLLDIDGVLNPWAAPTCPEDFDEYVFFPKDEQPHRLAKQHGRWIRDLAGTFEVVWASAWGMAANDLVGAVLDLPRFDWVPYPSDPFPPIRRSRRSRRSWAIGRRPGSTT